MRPIRAASTFSQCGQIGPFGQSHSSINAHAASSFWKRGADRTGLAIGGNSLLRLIYGLGLVLSSVTLPTASERHERRQVCRHGVIGEETPDHLLKPLPLLGYRIVSSPAQFLLDLSEF